MLYTYPQNLGIVIISLLGIVTSFFLKYLGNILKIIALGCSLLGYMPYKVFRHGVDGISGLQVVSVGLVAAGVFLFPGCEAFG